LWNYPKLDNLRAYNVMLLLSTDICSINTEKSARNAWESNIKLQNSKSIKKTFITIDL
jgi:hypothetical protein